jgi:simple sugar transport system ATP-binding protein
MALADRITILRKGRVAAAFLPGQVRSKRELARHMVGREVVLRVDKEPVEQGETVLRVEGLAGEDSRGREAFSDVALEVRRGQIVSVVGVAGNGQSALTAGLAGLGRLTRGTVGYRGTSCPARRWQGLARHAIAYVPENRYTVGSVPGMALEENYLLTTLDAYAGRLFLDRERARRDADQALRDFGVAAHSLRTRAGHLSGGNLQKLILARELSKAPDLFIAEQPTQGLDVKSTEDIWRAILAQRKRSAVLLVTGDLREALSLSDRIAVIFRGRILDVLDAADETAMGRVGLLMAGVRE